MHASLMIIPILHKIFPSFQQLDTSHISNHLLQLHFYFSPTEEVTGAETVLVPRIESNLLLSSHVYATPQFSIWNSCNKFLVRFRKKKLVQVNIFPNQFQKRKHSKKALGLKLKVILESNSIPVIKGKPGLFELWNFCKTICSAFFSESVISFFWVVFCRMVDNWNI